VLEIQPKPTTVDDLPLVLRELQRGALPPVPGVLQLVRRSVCRDVPALLRGNVDRRWTAPRFGQLRWRRQSAGRDLAELITDPRPRSWSC
jgi:hypothetical protein